MLLRSLFLLFFSSQVFSVGVCIDSPLLIETIRYVDIKDSQGNGALEPLESIETFNSVDKCNNVEILAFVNHSNSAVSLLVKDKKNIIYRYTKDGTTSDELISPFSGSSFDMASFSYNKIYVYDSVDQILYFWDGQSDTWVDASTVYFLPSGFYSSLFTVGYSTYISIDAGDTQGIWKIAEVAEKISDTPVSQGRVLLTHNGLAQAISEGDGRIILNYLDGDVSARIFDLNGYFVNFQSFKFESGTLFYFVGESDFKLYWDGINNFTDGYVQKPENFTLFKGCFGVSNGAVCSFISEEGKTQFYRIDGKKMVLDSEIDSVELTNSSHPITAYFMAGKYRYITAVNIQSKEHFLYRYSVLGGLEVVSKIGAQSEISYSSILTKSLLSEFLWIIKDDSRTGLYGVKLSGNVELENIIEVEEEIGEPLEGREETSNEGDEPIPRAELSGVISVYYLFLIMLLLIIGRRKA
jgi:hypothetical protein